MILSLCLPAALHAEVIPVNGRILGLDGEPAAGIEVRLERLESTFERARLRLELMAPGPTPELTVKTGKDGRFELLVPEPGMWKVVVAAAGTLPKVCLLEALVEDSDLPDLELEKAAALEVKLVDAEGAPRSGAVGVYSQGDRRSPWRKQLRLARAGDDGKAILAVGQDEKLELEALGEGLPLSAWKISDETSVTLDLASGLPVTLEIIGAQGRPIAGAIILQGTSLLPLGLSDEQGHFTLLKQLQKPGPLRILTADGWYGNAQLEDGSEVQEDAEADQRLRVQLEAPTTIHGTVLDISTRAAVAGSLVWATRGEFAATDAQGDFSLPVRLPARFVRANAAGYQSSFANLADSEGAETPTIGLNPVSEVSGTVVDGEGNALEGVRVDLQLAPQATGYSMAANAVRRRGWYGHSSPRGAFRVPGLPIGLGYHLRFSAPGFAPQTVMVPPLEALEKRGGLEVVMQPGRSAFGWVVDEGEVPVAGAQVVLRRTDSSAGATDVRFRSFSRRGEMESEKAGTDGEGRFEIDDLAPGRYALEVSASGFAPMSVPGVRLEPEENAVDLGVLVIIEGTAIEGRVVDAEGQGIAEAQVAVDSTGSNQPVATTRREAVSDQEGRFTIPDLTPKRPLVMVAYREGYATAILTDIRPPLEQAIDIVLGAAGQIHGRIVNGNGEAVEEAMIGVYSSQNYPIDVKRGRDNHARSDEEGGFSLENVEPGMINMTVQAKGYQQKNLQELELEPGAQLNLEIVLSEGALVEGAVRTSDGDPVAEASLMIAVADNEAMNRGFSGASGQTNPLGRYRVQGAPIGPARITVYHHGESLIEKDVELRAGSNIVDLVLKRSFEVSGQVVSEDGTPVEGANLRSELKQNSAYSYFSNTASQMSGVDGLFTFSNVSTGSYRIVASHPDFATSRSEVLDINSDVSGVLLELSRGATLSGRVLGLEFDQLGSLSLTGYNEVGGMRQGQVDFSATYTVEHLTPGMWHLQAQVAGAGSTIAIQVDIPEGVSLVEKDIEFGDGLTVSGQVVEGGQPAAGLNVGASGEHGHSSATTGSDGRFRLDGLKPGSYQIMVTGQQGIHHFEKLELEGERELLIEIPSAIITGIVRHQGDGSPIVGAQLVIKPSESGDPDFSDPWRYVGNNQAQSDDSGRFKIRRVRDGNWRLVASRSGFAPAEAQISVSGAVAPEVELRMTPTEGVSFELVTDSLPASSVHVAVYGPSGQMLTSNSYRVSDGKVNVSTVPPGQWNLVVQTGDSAAVLFPVNAPGDQGQLSLPKGGGLNVRIPELEKMPSARIKLTGPDGQPAVAVHGLWPNLGEQWLMAGQGVFKGLKPGTWTYTVSHEGNHWSGSAEVTAGGSTESSP